MALIPFVLFVIGLVFLIKGADLLVTGAASIARRFKVSDLFIGLTIVAFGTSTPELFVNLIASFKGNTDIAIGNIIGSNIANILLILGISAVIYPLSVTKGTVWKEIPLSLLAVVLLGVLANDKIIDRTAFSLLSRIDGIVLLSFFVIFLYYSFSIAGEIQGVDDIAPEKQYPLFLSFFLIILGLGGLTLGGKWMVDGALTIAVTMGMSQSLVGLTIVAVGTSLPELATSAVAAYRRNVDIAVGNVVGSNIFNVFFVLGISSCIRPLPFKASNTIDIGVAVVASLLLFLCMFTGKRHSLDRWEGVLFLTMYGGYVVFLILQG